MFGDFMTLWFEGVTDVLPIYYVSIIDLRMNPFKEMVNDENKQASPNDPLKVLIEFITRSKTKKIKNEFNELSQDVWIKKLQIY